MFKKFNQAAGLNTGQPARSGYDRVWITPAGYEAFNPAVARPTYEWELISINPDSGPFSPVIEAIDSLASFEQAVEMAASLNHIEAARGVAIRYCVRRAGSGAAPFGEVDLPF